MSAYYATELRIEDTRRRNLTTPTRPWARELRYRIADFPWENQQSDMSISIGQSPIKSPIGQIESQSSTHHPPLELLLLFSSWDKRETIFTFRTIDINKGTVPPYFCFRGLSKSREFLMYQPFQVCTRQS